MGDQRRRSKSGGCQKEQEEGEERVGMCVQVYTEWVWPLFTVHSGERRWGRDEEGMRTEVGGRGQDVREQDEGGGANKKHERSKR